MASNKHKGNLEEHGTNNTQIRSNVEFGNRANDIDRNLSDRICHQSMAELESQTRASTAEDFASYTADLVNLVHQQMSRLIGCLNGLDKRLQIAEASIKALEKQRDPATETQQELQRIVGTLRDGFDDVVGALQHKRRISLPIAMSTVASNNYPATQPGSSTKPVQPTSAEHSFERDASADHPRPSIEGSSHNLNDHRRKGSGFDMSQFKKTSIYDLLDKPVGEWP